MKKNILFISALPDHHRVNVVSANLNGVLKYKYPGTCDFYHYMSPPDWNKKQILLDHRDKPIQLSPQTHYLFNQVAEPDTHTRGLEQVQNLLERYPQLPVFNAPSQIVNTRRDRVYQRLKQIEGLVVPQTVCMQPRSPQDVQACMAEANMQYPVIVKAAGSHNGQHMVRLENERDLFKLDAFAFDGRPYYLIQYYETGQNGIYKKHRLVMVRGQFYPRHLCVWDHWAIEFRKSYDFMAQNPAYFDEEAEFIQQFATRWAPTLAPLGAQIYEHLPIDFVGLDCCFLPDGRLLLFEMNANMLMLTSNSGKPAHIEAIVQIKSAIHAAYCEDMAQRSTP